MAQETPLFPLRKGRHSRQAHVDLPAGTFEEEHARQGFFGRTTHLYRLHPTTDWTRIEGPLRPHSYDLNDLTTRADAAIRASMRGSTEDAFAPICLLHNSDVALHWVAPKTMDFLYRNADGDDVYYIHAGGGKLETTFGARLQIDTGVPAVEPDIRGAKTIREQLDKHRTLKSCATCHVKIDPAGFALENFDVFGGWRDRYRALGEGKPSVGFGKNGQPFEFHDALPVDASGDLPGGGAFKNVVELKRLLLKDERQLARNLVRQLVVYATGASVRFGDRDRVESILDRAAPSGYGVRTIVREIVMSELFQRK